MKTTIKLLLLYIVFQFLGAFLVLIPRTIYAAVKYGNVVGIEPKTLAPAMLMSFFLMTLYLWKAGHISTDKATWSPVSAVYLLLSLIIGVAAITIVDYVQSLMPWLPNIMEHSFDLLQSNWLGILCIAVLGPIVEELIFRGAITRALLKTYRPVHAILISALVFGVIHMNPVQVIAGVLIGALLAWIYYKTASLIPCILIHIFNNTLSVYLYLRYPDVENMSAFFSNNTYYLYVVAAVVVFIGTFLLMKRTTIPYPWKEKTTD